MKKTIKLISVFLVSVVVGILIGGLLFMVFNGGSLSDYFNKLLSTDILEILQIAGYMLLWMLVSCVLQVIFHEGGHLVAGLLTGYRFVSFRVFSLTLIKKEGQFRLRRFSIGGTGGQCLMSPPDRPIEQIDTRWYNLGGVLANLMVSAAAVLAICLCNLPMWAETLMLMLAIIGVIYALLNGIPMKVSGLGNDGYNLLHLEKSPLDKRLLCQMLHANANVQAGQQPKELPSSFFDRQEKVDWGDGLQANWQMMVVARMENLHQWEEAYNLLSEALSEKEKIPGLFLLEMECEMVFVCLVTGKINEARHLYTDKLKTYIKTYLNTQSSKQRITFAVTLIMDGKKEEARQMLSNLKQTRHQYVLEGEAEMDIDLMEWLYRKESNMQTVGASS